MEANNLFFCLRANETNWPRSKVTFLLYSVHLKEASWCYQHKDKEIIYWPPFMNTVHFPLLLLLLLLIISSPLLLLLLLILLS